jgi:hypothetical protein
VSGPEEASSGKEERTPNKAQKYEKKNIYYKAVFRDIRRYFLEILKHQSSSESLESSITKMLTQIGITFGDDEVEEMIAILAPFLNYTRYMVEFADKRINDAKCILDCLQNFTLTKMRKVLQYPAIQLLVKHYFEQTVAEGESSRLSSHKTMKKNPGKYLGVLHKIVGLCDQQ